MSDVSLPARMRQAAELLIEVSQLYEAFDPTRYPWCASELLHEADVIEEEP